VEGRGAGGAVRANDGRDRRRPLDPGGRGRGRIDPLNRGGRPLRPSAVEIACLVAGLGLTLTYAWLLDDAYIYFKYVDNWLFLGRGLVYNPGEYAEGFTSPLWLLLLAALRRTGLGFWTIVRGTGILAVAAFWWGGVLVHRRLAPVSAFRLNLPLVLLSFNYALLSYFTSGTESPLVAVAAAAYALCLLGSRSRLAQVAVGLSPLVRPELALAWLLAAAWLSFRRRRPAWLILASGLGANGGWLLFRALYYADLFPTTFYLKVHASPIQGLIYLYDALTPYGLHAWAAAGVILILIARRRRWEKPDATEARLAMLGVAAVMTLHVVAIGGDARHFRYLAFPVCLGTFALAGLVEIAWRPGLRRPPAATAPIAGLALALVVLCGMPRQVDRHPIGRLLFPGSFTAGRLAIVDGIADAELHRLHAELPPLSPWKSGAPIEMRPLYDAWRHGGGADPPHAVNAEYLCWYHYRHFDQWSVHGFGLTDVVLARSRGGARPDDRPGHRMTLLDRSREEADILLLSGLPPRAGVYRAAVDAGRAPGWVRANLPVLELLERKIYGPRGARESLRLATHVTERIDLDAAPPGAPATLD
jgi:hypothetical protein